MIAVFIAVTLVALWVAAWLHWVFVGSIRQFLFAKVFPARWRGGRTARQILFMPSSSAAGIDNVGNFLAVESAAPDFVNGVLGCPGCLSAHLAAVGVVFAVPLLPWDLAISQGWASVAALASSLPLIWAASAWIGHRLHARL